MKCQGRPDGECPDSRNDHTVHNTIADLFLCDACEEYRWPSKKSSKNDNSSVNGRSTRQRRQATKKEVVKVGSVTEKSTSAGASSQQDNAIPVCSTRNNSRDDSVHEDMCPVCNEGVSGNGNDDTKFIECSCCKQAYHEQCTGISSEILQVLLRIVSATGWVCRQCRENFVGLQSALNKAAEEISDMRTSIAWLFEEVKCLKQSANTTNATNDGMNGQLLSSSAQEASLDKQITTKTVTEVHRVLHDAAKRKLNVVVTGLPETVGSGSEIHKEDSESFIKFCEENLVVKPPLARKGCMRLGKRVDDRPRKLLVHLTSESSVTSLLSASRNMQRTETTKSFYINPDLSPGEAQLAFEQRQKRRATSNMVKRNTGSTSKSTVSPLAPSTVIVINSPDGHSSDVVTRSNLSATSAEFHLATTLSSVGNNSGPSTSSTATNKSSASVATTVPDSPSCSPFFRS